MALRQRPEKLDPLLWEARLELRRQGRSQASVAADMGVTGRQLNLLLTGTSPANLMMVRKVYEVLGLELLAARPVYLEPEED